jgi:hypothetical protein
MIIKSLDVKSFPYDHVFFFTWTSVSRRAGYKWMDTRIVVVWVMISYGEKVRMGVHLVIAIVICFGCLK